MPLALESVTVSVRLPFAFSTVTPVLVRSKVPLPVVSCCAVLDRPLALVVVTVSPSFVPLALVSVTVSVRLPLALITVTSVSTRSKVPLPVASIWVVTDSPLALVVLMVWSFSEPSALVSVTVSTLLPLAAVTTVSIRSNWPLPVEIGIDGRGLAIGAGRGHDLVAQRAVGVAVGHGLSRAAVGIEHADVGPRLVERPRPGMVPLGRDGAAVGAGRDHGAVAQRAVGVHLRRRADGAAVRIDHGGLVSGEVDRAVAGRVRSPRCWCVRRRWWW